jgi:cell fate regulator YaaT (PSP1 superfamily)
MQYNFPPVRFVDTNTPKQQVNHIFSEVIEAATECDDQKWHLCDREVMDTYHSCESYFRIREKMGMDLNQVFQDTKNKNYDRGYYDHES